ncbi:aldo/keto reductase [Paenibacillus filicis]|uniref:Aldo/keto reductase n=1 Tax=Paenibacillus filicis TaxID=669464 RepID=A0ABU9DIW5_9BACL
MERVQLAEGLSFSRLVHGHWRLADWSLRPEQILELVEYDLELGISTLDHADIYGNYSCEALFGQALALKPELRSQIELVTKCGIMLRSDERPAHKLKHYDTSHAHIIASVESSLSNLQTDYIDLLLIHRPDPLMNPSEIAEAFAKLKQEGKVRSFGVSNFTPAQFNMLQSYLDIPLVTNQIEISAATPEPFLDGSLDHCLERRILPMAWSPLAGGQLFQPDNLKFQGLLSAVSRVAEELEADSIDQVLYAWLLHHPARILPIIGSGNKDRIAAAAASLRLQLSRQQWFEIWQASLGHEVS